MRSGLGDDGVVLLEQSDILTQLKTVPTNTEGGLMALKQEYVIYSIGLRSTPSVSMIMADH